jgi:Skp family chaperone for outer membrane proteins
MNANTQATLAAVAGAAETTASSLMPSILQAMSAASAAATPQAAAAIFAGEIIFAMVKAGQATPADLATMYQGLAAPIASAQAQIDAAAKAAGA